MKALLDSIQRKFSADARLRKTGRVLLDIGKPPADFHPYVMLGVEMSENLDGFDSPFKLFSVIFEAHTKGTNRSKIDSLMANIRRVYDDLVEQFAGINIAAMYRKREDIGIVVEGASSLWIGVIEYECYVEPLLAEAEAVP